MYLTPEKHTAARDKKKKLVKRGLEIALCLVTIVAVFMVGLNVGNGRISITKGNQQNATLPQHLDYTRLDKVYQELKSNYDGKLDQAKLLDGAKKGMTTAAGDQYTMYFTADEAKTFNDQLQGTFSGIGAELGKDAQGNIIIVTPIEGTPASKAGLRPQDIVAEIDGKSTAGLEIDAAVSKIRGPKGTKVTLKIVRDKQQELDVPIVRDDIKVPSVKSEMLDGNIGYMKINQFSDDTADLAQKAAQEFKDKHVKGIVLDLRGNPGGLVTAAIRVSSLWLPEGKTILQEKEGNVAVETDLANGNNTLQGIPTVVLVDQGSASASEITAGALKDNGVATIMGIKSYGKGSVQKVIPLPGGAEMKITVARWYRPNGQNIDKKGISPDTEVKITNDDIKANKDPQKDAAADFLRK